MYGDEFAEVELPHVETGNTYYGLAETALGGYIMVTQI